jgi:tetratricopeptide (TPR) repeat protein
VYALLQDYREAKRDLDLAADLNGAMPEIYQSRGLVEMLIGHFDKAEKDFSQAVALGADDNLLLYNRGVARAMLGDSAGAHEDYARSCHNGYLPACPFGQNILFQTAPAL